MKKTDNFVKKILRDKHLYFRMQIVGVKNVGLSLQICFISVKSSLNSVFQADKYSKKSQLKVIVVK